MMMRMLALMMVGVLALACSFDLSAQDMPSTDVFVLEMPSEAIDYHADPANLTDRDGYDNQPSFTPDGEALLMTSIWEDEQADIYRIHLRSGVARRLTFTSESEYSPTVLPDGSGFSVVRVEADGEQRLWKFDSEGRNPELLIDLAPVGYHAWGSEDRLALFVLGEPHSLVLADLDTGDADTVAANIGRSLQHVPGTDAVSFIQKGEGEWTIRVLDTDTGEVATLTSSLQGAEDFAWTPEGRVLMADGPVVYQWTRETDAWEPYLDFTDSEEIGTITRIAVSPQGDLIAFVAERRR